MLQYNEKKGNETMYSVNGIHQTFNNDEAASTLTIGLLLTGSVFLIVVILAFVAVLYKYQRRKTAEYQRAAQIHIKSTRNAGIYMDLAMDSPISKSGLPIGAPIYNSLKKHPDQYTFISDDELDI